MADFMTQDLVNHSEETTQMKQSQPNLPSEGHAEAAAPGVDTAPAPGSLAAFQEKLTGAQGTSYWRSLEDLAATPQFEELLHREFPRQAAEWDGRVDRRKFLSLAGASMGLAGLTACTKQPGEKIIPYVRQPEELVPGKALFFATSMGLGGYARALLAESHMGRPTKVEGNPEHPASLGSSDLMAQASVLGLYDPDRSQVVTHLGKIATWTAFVDLLAGMRSTLEALGGEGLRFLTGTTTSPTVQRLMAEIKEAMPQARWHQLDTVGHSVARQGTAMAFGTDAETRYDFTQADVVLSLDSEVLEQGPGAVRYSKDFASRRKVSDKASLDQMSRLYSVESAMNGMSAVADHRLPLPPADVAKMALAIAVRLGAVQGSAPSGFDSGDMAIWAEEIAADLQAHQGRCLVVAGDQTSPELHVLAHAMNAALGNVGTTVHYTEPVAAAADGGSDSFAELLADMEAGKVENLFILGANPVYAAAADQDVASALGNVKMRVHLGSHVDETSEYCHWHIPESHYLESWGDLRAFDGTVSLGQPLIEPLYGSKSIIDVLSALLGQSTTTAEDQVRATLEATGGGGDFEKLWRRSVHDGWVADSAAASLEVAMAGTAASTAAQTIGSATSGDLQLSFRPDSRIYDGRFANNGWLQECPDGITKLTWDNALLMSPATAESLGFGDLVEGNDQRAEAPMARLSVGDNSLDLPVWVTPGQADGALVLHLGYGRTRCGNVGNGYGFDAGQVRSTASQWQVTEGVSVSRIDGEYLLASTQDHHSMEGRHMVGSASLADYKHYEEAKAHGDDHAHNPVQAHLHVDPAKTLMNEEIHPYNGYKWGMSIDLTTCTGCNACLVACVAENNIAVVGKEEVLRGREMHWIRIDRYFGGNGGGVDEVINQPVPCMQCEQAPCEVVCPVAATVHSDEGLNDMVYNRCVGTRYCSNNCPYKVRRFNFFLYSDFETPSLQLGRNPNVTVRSRGVMEKCTYCVQRINKARITAKREDRKILEGEVVTACQSACPSDSIVFGDLNDPQSEVAQRKASSLDYSLLAELGNRPRTTYLGRIRNINQSLFDKLNPESASHLSDHSGGH